MSGRYLRLVSSPVLALLFAVTIGFAHAATTPLPANSSAFGKGYAQLTSDWLEWLVAIPAGSNPLFDSDGAFAAVGQSGKVWFLVGTTGGPATRTVTVPSGIALFFPIVNFFWVNTPEYGDALWSPEQEKFVRGILEAQIDTAHGLSLQVDGRFVSDLSSLRVSGAVGKCMVPDDNIFGIPFAPGPHECLADGYWALLPPLSSGDHTIRFTGGMAPSFSLDVTYRVTVRGR